jgi:hypothetical protein
MVIACIARFENKGPSILYMSTVNVFLMVPTKDLNWLTDWSSVGRPDVYGNCVLSQSD